MSKTTNATRTKKVNRVSTPEQIRQKAFELYLVTGNSNEMENWLKAERELSKK
jgi:hypothetical protein